MLFTVTSGWRGSGWGKQVSRVRACLCGYRGGCNGRRLLADTWIWRGGEKGGGRSQEEVRDGGGGV